MSAQSPEVSTDFENANLQSHEVLSSTHIRATVRAEADQNGRNRQPSWFYFRIDATLGRELTVDLTGFEGEYNFKPTDGQWAGRMRPFYSYDNRTWRSFDRTEWDRDQVRLRLRLTPEASRVWVARIPPYTNEHLEALLSGLQTEVIGTTPQGRKMRVVTITNEAVPVTKKKVIWVIARQHAWEAGTSWVAEGAIRYLLSPAAKGIRDTAVFRILPMCDPDGVARGGVRFNANGFDLNRNWDAIDPKLMPEIAMQREAILRDRRIDLFLTLHNDEADDYIEGPAEHSKLGERLWSLLDANTSFESPGGPRTMRPTTTEGMKGRMTVNQGLYNERKIPAFLMELKTERNSKLGRELTVADRLDFGAALVRALHAAITAQTEE